MNNVGCFSLVKILLGIDRSPIPVTERGCWGLGGFETLARRESDGFGVVEVKRRAIASRVRVYQDSGIWAKSPGALVMSMVVLVLVVARCKR